MFKFDYNKYRNIYNFCQRKINILSIFRILVFLAFIICFCIGGIFNFIGFIFVICFIFLIIIHDKYYKKFSYYENCLDIFEEYKSRTNSKWKEIKNNGEKYNNELFNDLNVVGKSSLFQYLNFCRTIGGEEKLIQQLSNKKKDFDKLKKYQSVIKELNDKPYFCVDFLESLSCFKDKNINLENNFDLLNNNLKIRDMTLDLQLKIKSQIKDDFDLDVKQVNIKIDSVEEKENEKKESKKIVEKNETIIESQKSWINQLLNKFGGN